jgi:hypothetical protein
VTNWEGICLLLVEGIMYLSVVVYFDHGVKNNVGFYRSFIINLVVHSGLAADVKFFKCIHKPSCVCEMNGFHDFFHGTEGVSIH